MEKQQNSSMNWNPEAVAFVSRDTDGPSVSGKNIIEEGVMVPTGREESWFPELRTGAGSSWRALRNA